MIMSNEKIRWSRHLQKYGLRDHPTRTHEVSPFDGVTLACTRDQEAVSHYLTLVSPN